MKRKLLSVGDKLYKYTFMSGILEYIVYEVRETEDSVLYAIRGLSCKHTDGSEPCEVLVTGSSYHRDRGDNNQKFMFVQMLNNDDGDQTDYTYYNDTEKYMYFTSREYALLDVYKQSLKSLLDKKSEQEKSLKETNNKITELNTLINELERS